jgi:hypothetical protein
MLTKIIKTINIGSILFTNAVYRRERVIQERSNVHCVQTSVADPDPYGSVSFWPPGSGDPSFDRKIETEIQNTTL